MFIVLAILLVIAALAAVAYPVIRRTAAAGPETTSAQETLDELLAQREAGMQALRELNFDHRVGKITDEDFVAFEASLKRNAANTLRALDQWEAEADDVLDQTLEREIAARRAALSTGTIPCPSCGRPASAADKFCASCGASLAEARPVATPANTCPKCGRAVEPGDRFCAGCGQSL